MVFLMVRMKIKMAAVRDKYAVREPVPINGEGEKMEYGRIAPKRPVVQRKGNKVVKCTFYKDMKRCFGLRCFWPRVGKCPIYERLQVRQRKAK